jgi:hypothetical protein
MSNRILPALAVLAVIAGVIAVFFVEDRPGAAPSATEAAAPASSRVEIAAITLPRADGGTFSSAALQGKSPLILNFFATW